MDFYFSRFEHRRPPEPLSTPSWVRMIWQVFAVAALVLGANYIYWRWTASLNTDALWYAIPLVLADTLARSVIAPQQLPVGVLTALIGVPAFLLLLARDARTK